MQNSLNRILVLFKFAFNDLIIIEYIMSLATFQLVLHIFNIKTEKCLITESFSAFVLSILPIFHNFSFSKKEAFPQNHLESETLTNGARQFRTKSKSFSINLEFVSGGIKSEVRWEFLHQVWNIKFQSLNQNYLKHKKVSEKFGNLRIWFNFCGKSFLRNYLISVI